MPRLRSTGITKLCRAGRDEVFNTAAETNPDHEQYHGSHGQWDIHPPIDAGDKESS